MKKIIALLLAIFTVAGLVACTNGNENKKETTGDTTEMEIDYSAKNYKAKDIADKIKLTGRSQIGENGIYLDWTWASASFSGWFDGDIVADFTAGYGYLADIRVVVDGDFENATVHTIDMFTSDHKDLVLCTVSKGEHTITIYKDSQAINGGANIENIRFNGTLNDKPADNDIKIEIIGDSISCGAGATDNGRNEGAADTSYYAYGAMLARELPADVSVVSVSGWGLANGGGSTTAIIPNLYNQINYFRDKEATWDFANNQVDVVIISLGTNDYVLANQGKFDEFYNAANNFLKNVRSKYPNAEIIWIYGQMLEQYNDTLRGLIDNEGDGKMYYYDVEKWIDGGYGHPSAKGHRVYADFLKGKISEILGK